MLLPIVALLAASSTQSPVQPRILTQGFALRDHQSGPFQLPKDQVFYDIAQGNWNEAYGAMAAGWTKISADKKGHFTGHFANNGWIDIKVHEDADETVLLDALGDSYVLVNGAPRVGDVYESGYAKLPIHLHAGNNDLLFRCVRGDLFVQLLPIHHFLALDASDPTLPDLRPHQSGKVWGALLLRNSTKSWQNHLVIKVQQGGASTSTQIPSIMPMSLRKVGFQILANKSPQLHLQLLDGSKVLDSLNLTLRERKEGETYKQTFVSKIDGSVQYFAVNPAWHQKNAALALSLHGAGVEAIGQADAYSSKPWCNIVCPTNRRPFGFDWEDWGRMDALEVLKIAEKELKPDPSRIYLVGHSMGGHGTILNGALYPGKFAAIAPSAGWISAATYAGIKPVSHPGLQVSMLQRASYQDETRRYLANYKAEGVYLLQGGADDTVPPTEERTLSKLLSTFDHDYVYHEVPGMGHWWDINPEPGADCIDLSNLWDYLARHALPPIESVHNIDFSTSNPEVSRKEYWATIEEQRVPLRISRIVLHADPFLRKFYGNTRNVKVLKLNCVALHAGKGLEVDLDGQTLTLNVNGSNSNNQSVWLKKENGKWQQSTKLGSMEKTPERNGPYRFAFQHRFLFVYGTHGTMLENRLLLQKVRYDAETWWYRANGSVDVEPDSDFSLSQAKDRNVILYGNANTNTAFGVLLPHCPVSIHEGVAQAFSVKFQPDNVAALYWWPRAGTSNLSVGVVGATGPAGIRSTFLVPYLQPMTGFPDYLFFNPSAFDPQSQGDPGVLQAGFYTNHFQYMFPDVGDHLAATPLDRVDKLTAPANSKKPA